MQYLQKRQVAPMIVGVLRIRFKTLQAWDLKVSHIAFILPSALEVIIQWFYSTSGLELVRRNALI